MAPSSKIRVLIFPESDKWVAQCLEHDICAQADSVEELEPRIRMAVLLDLEETVKRHGQAFRDIPPAPDRFRLMWDRRTGLSGGFVIDSAIGGTVTVELGLAA